jgi:hypothetical protein
MKQVIKFKGKYTLKSWIGITIKVITINVYEVTQELSATCDIYVTEKCGITDFHNKYTLSKAWHFHELRLYLLLSPVYWN